MPDKRPVRSAQHTAHRRTLAARATAILGIGLLCALPACRTVREQALDAATLSYAPSNHGVYLDPAEVLPPGRRIAVLPLFHPEMSEDELASYDQTLYRNFAAVERYEWVRVSRQDLAAWTGLRQVTPVSPLPASLFSALRRHLAADGVLFAELTHLHPYKPLDLGLRTRLTTIDSRETVWAADHGFNAGRRDVAVAARRYAYSRQSRDFPLDTSESILASPSRFFDFASWETAVSLAQSAR